MNKVINKKFYSRNTLETARSLLGMILCRRLENGEVIKGKIVETEAYTQDEPSCHAYKGITKRSETMFRAPGIAYVYFTYGMYHCLNIITEKEGFGAGVLIRAIEPLSDINQLSPKILNTNGPAKLCRTLNITRKLNSINVCSKKSPIWLEYGNEIKDSDIIQTTRIGIKQAADLPWRFYIKDNKFVSKP